MYDSRVHAVWKPSGISLHQSYTACGSSASTILSSGEVDCQVCILVLEQPETDRMSTFLGDRLADEPAQQPRALRDVYAKAELLNRFRKMDGILQGYAEMRFAVRLAASVYSDHPDYRAEWAPVWNRKDWT
jgi:hypothetical protein